MLLGLWLYTGMDILTVLICERLESDDCQDLPVLR